MDDQPQDVLALVREKRHRIAALEAELATLRSELAAVVRELVPAEAVAPKPAHRQRGAGGRNAIRMAEQVLREAGRPLHVSDIMTAIEQRFGEAVRYTTLVSNISRLVKQGRTFYRSAPNEFGVLEAGEPGEPMSE